MTTEYYFGNPDMVRLSTELACRGHQVDVLTSYSPSFYQFDKPEGADGINIIEANPHIDIVSLPYTVTFPFRQVAKIIRQRKIDICHSVMARATNSAAVSFVAKQLGVPHVHTVQGIGTQTGRIHVDLIAEVYDRIVVRFVLGSARKVIVLSESLAEYAVKRGASPERIVVVPSGIDCSLFNPERSEVLNDADAIREKLGIPSDSVVVGYIGRIVPVKGLKYLVLALNDVKKRRKDIHLLIVGDGFEKAELQRMTRKLRLNAHFVGWEKNVPPFYAAIDIFVLPSLFEGLSNSLLEAMAMGKPIIATRVGGNKDIILNGKNGFLIPTRNPQAISSHINKLVESTQLRETIGRFNRETALKEFRWEKTVSKIEQIYEDIVVEARDIHGS
jgi:glycosyltransferase involved in cell wall biosynthesis